MTAIISWLNRETETEPYLIAVGDSKITGNHGGSLEGAKIFELPIRCRDLTTMPQAVYYQRSIGCSFAGSTLVGFNVYSFLQTAFANLGGRDINNDIPDYKSLCNKAEEALELYVTAIRSPAEINLYGFCPRSSLPFIGSIRSVQLEDGSVSHQTEIKDEFTNDIDYTLLGDHKEELNDLLAVGLNTDQRDIWYWRSPALILKRVITEGQFESIGGNLQIGVCYPNSFNSYGVVINQPENTAKMKFRNIDFTEDIMRTVGPCNIALGGYMIEPAGN